MDGESYPTCYVKESCRGAPNKTITGKQTGFRNASATLISGPGIRGGASGVAKAGTVIPWMECVNVGDTSAMIGVPKKTYSSVKQCYDDSLMAKLDKKTVDGSGKNTSTIQLAYPQR